MSSKLYYEKILPEENSAEAVIFLAAQLSALKRGDRIDAFLRDDILDLANQESLRPVVAAVWLRIGVDQPLETFESLWIALPLGQRLALALAMLDLDPLNTVRTLQSHNLAALITTSSNPRLDREVAQALSLCRVVRAEDCLIVMDGEGQLILAPVLAEWTSFTDEKAPPEWLEHLSAPARQRALLRLGFTALTRGHLGPFISCLNQMQEMDLKEFSEILSQECRFDLISTRFLAQQHERLPLSQDFLYELCAALIGYAEELVLTPTVILSLANRLMPTKLLKTDFEKRRATRNFTKKQQTMRHALLGKTLSFSSVEGEKDAKALTDRKQDQGRSDPLDKLIAGVKAEVVSCKDWEKIEECFGTESNPYKIIRAITRLSHVLDRRQLIQAGAWLSELPATAWRKEADAALSRRALFLEIDPRSIAKGLDRQELVAQVMHARLLAGNFKVFEHAAWLRLSKGQQVALLGFAFNKMENQGNQTVRCKWIKSLICGILQLPADFKTLQVIELIRRFNQDPVLTKDLLWQLQGITDLVAPQREEMLRSLALAFWLRGNQQEGNRCQAEAEVCARQVVRAQVYNAISELRSFEVGSDLKSYFRRLATIIATLEVDDVGKESILMECLAEQGPADFQSFVAYLILHGQAPDLLIALTSIGRKYL